MAASVMIPRMERQDKRLVDQLRPISFETGIAPNATASVLSLIHISEPTRPY